MTSSPLENLCGLGKPLAKEPPDAREVGSQFGDSIFISGCFSPTVGGLLLAADVAGTIFASRAVQIAR